MKVEQSKGNITLCTYRVNSSAWRGCLSYFLTGNVIQCKHCVTSDFPRAFSIYCFSPWTHLLYYLVYISRNQQKINVPMIHSSLSFGNCRNFYHTTLSYCYKVLVVCVFFLTHFPPSPKSEYPETRTCTQSLSKKLSEFKFYLGGGKKIRFLSLNRMSACLSKSCRLFVPCENSAIE